MLCKTSHAGDCQLINQQQFKGCFTQGRATQVKVKNRADGLTNYPSSPRSSYIWVHACLRHMRQEWVGLDKDGGTMLNSRHYTEYCTAICIDHSLVMHRYICLQQLRTYMFCNPKSTRRGLIFQVRGQPRDNLLLYTTYCTAISQVNHGPRYQ